MFLEELVTSSVPKEQLRMMTIKDVSAASVDVLFVLLVTKRYVLYARSHCFFIIRNVWHHVL
jgi:hypothetical protein